MILSNAVLPGTIGYIGGRDRLYCSHTDVVRTFLSPPTAYTTISGNEGRMCLFVQGCVYDSCANTATADGA